MVSTKMTAIADKIRSILGITGKMGLDAMATNLGTEQTNVENAFTAVGNKGGTVPSSKISGNLASAIASIPEGVTVQRDSGSFTTNNNGAATVNCGFQPDVVIVTGFTYSGSNGTMGEMQLAFVFPEKTTTRIANMVAYNDTYAMIEANITISSSGFTINKMTSYDDNWSTTTLKNKTYNYVAIKYS